MSTDTPPADDAGETTFTNNTIVPAEAPEERVPYERFQQANQKAKEAAQKTAKLEKELADIRAQMEEREAAGLPELERERKRAEALEKRATEAEQRAEQAMQQQVRSQRERLVIAAARDLDDPSDALRYPEFINLDDIEDADQAERAVKRLVKAKPKLLKDTEPSQPQIGRVLEGGKPKNGQTSNIDLDSEAQMLAERLKQFTRS